VILADSGFWIALGNRRDHHHKIACAALERRSSEGFVTTWPVLTEVTHLLVARVGSIANLYLKLREKPRSLGRGWIAWRTKRGYNFASKGRTCPVRL